MLRICWLGWNTLNTEHPNPCTLVEGRKVSDLYPHIHCEFVWHSLASFWEVLRPRCRGSSFWVPCVLTTGTIHPKPNSWVKEVFDSHFSNISEELLAFRLGLVWFTSEAGLSLPMALHITSIVKLDVRSEVTCLRAWLSGFTPWLSFHQLCDYKRDTHTLWDSLTETASLCKDESRGVSQVPVLLSDSFYILQNAKKNS